MRRRRRRSDLVFHVKRRWSNNSERKQETSNHLKQFKTKCWSTAVKEDPSFLSWFYLFVCVIFSYIKLIVISQDVDTCEAAESRAHESVYEGGDNATWREGR